MMQLWFLWSNYAQILGLLANDSVEQPMTAIPQSNQLTRLNKFLKKLVSSDQMTIPKPLTLVRVVDVTVPNRSARFFNFSVTSGYGEKIQILQL